MSKAKEKEDGERELVEHVYQYLVQNHYPDGCDKNHKWIIKKKAKKFLVKDGVLHYNVEKNGKVRYVILGPHVAF